jgi:hypothetical protein
LGILFFLLLENPGLVGLKEVVQTDVGVRFLQSWRLAVPLIALILLVRGKITVGLS